MVRLRQLIDHVRHRLLFIPIVFVGFSIAVSQLTLWADRNLGAEHLPQIAETTVGSGRAILSAIAAGLISSVTLLLSLMLVAVQLASSQFSPRSLRDWIGDRTQQVTIGVVLGTTVYCLMVLRETRTFGEGEALTPHLSVLLALLAGVLSLVAVVRSVDHLTDSLRVGRVAGNIATETVRLIELGDQLETFETPPMVPSASPDGARPESGSNDAPRRPDDAHAVTATRSGWIQQIDEPTIMAALPDDSTAFIATPLGAFTLPDAPLMWIWPAPDDDEVVEEMRLAVAIGDTRTMQQDIGFGLVQLVDIALRALSPGVNDPNTANDLIVNMGVVMLALWERPIADAVRTEERKTLVRHQLSHGEYLHAAFDQLRRYGAADSEVAATMIRTLANLHDETVRRGLPGPLDPIEETIDQILEAVDASDLSDYDKQLVRELAPAGLDRLTP